MDRRREDQDRQDEDDHGGDNRGLHHGVDLRKAFFAAEQHQQVQDVPLIAVLVAAVRGLPDVTSTRVSLAAQSRAFSGVNSGISWLTGVCLAASAR